MSKRTAYEASTSGNPANIKLDNVTPLWLEAGPRERYLLLEDPETGDILMPLIYMKHILEANYSRKLASLKHRLVTVPPNHALSRQEGLLYWQWAFESPHSVKVVVRKEIGEATPQGHLRLVLLPIVYNALVVRQDLRSTPLFRALHRAIRPTSYWSLLRLPGSEIVDECDSEAGILGRALGPPPLFRGPRAVESTAMKYMFMFRDHEEMEASKRTRTTGTAAQDNGVLTAAIGGTGPDDRRPGSGMLADSETASENNDTQVAPPTAAGGGAGAGNGAGPSAMPVPVAGGGGVMQRPVDISPHLIETVLRHSTPTGIPAAQRRDFAQTEAAILESGMGAGKDMRPVLDRKLLDLLREVECLKMCVVQMYNVLTGVTSHQGAANLGGAVNPSLPLVPPPSLSAQPQSSALPRNDRHGPLMPPPSSANGVPPVVSSVPIHSSSLPPTVPPWPPGSMGAADPGQLGLSADLTANLSSFLGSIAAQSEVSMLLSSFRGSPPQTAGDNHIFSSLLPGGPSLPDSWGNRSLNGNFYSSLPEGSAMGMDLESSPPDQKSPLQVLPTDGGAAAAAYGAVNPNPSGAPAATVNKAGADGKLTVPTPKLPGLQGGVAMQNDASEATAADVEKEKAQMPSLVAQPAEAAGKEEVAAAADAE